MINCLKTLATGSPWHDNGPQCHRQGRRKLLWGKTEINCPISDVSLNKIFEMCEAHEEVRFSPYLSQVNTTKIKISKQLSEKVAHNFSEKKTGTVYSSSEKAHLFPT
jgi:hypothetical protein